LAILNTVENRSVKWAQNDSPSKIYYSIEKSNESSPQQAAGYPADYLDFSQ